MVSEATPDAAGATFQKLRGRFAGAAAIPGLADEAFTATDAYLGGIVVFRKRERVAGVANVKPGEDGAALARRLVGTLP